MKNLLTLLLLCTCAFGNAQDKINYTKVPIKTPETANQLKEETYNNYLLMIDTLTEHKGRKVIKRYNFIVLNRFFSSEITALSNNVKDIALENYFLSVDSESKEVSIGKSTDLGKFWRQHIQHKSDEECAIKKLTNIFTWYATTSITDGYSKIYSKDKVSNQYDFNSSIGIGLRYTHFGNGTINFGTKTHADISKKNINTIRENIIRDNVVKKIKGYVDDEYLEDKVLAVINSDNDTIPVIKRKYFEYLAFIADTEVKYLKEKKMYKSYRTWWWGFGTFIPLTPKIIKATTSNTDTAIKKHEFRNWSARAFASYYNVYASGISNMYTFEGSVFNNNNFLAEKADTFTFRKLLFQDADGMQIFGDPTTAFIGAYDKFKTFSVKGEAKLLFFENSMGISLGLERYLGQLRVTNWKIGFPFSLKDKDGKPTVNFEINWKEINKEHLVGLTANYVFGNFTK